MEGNHNHATGMGSPHALFWHHMASFLNAPQGHIGPFLKGSQGLTGLHKGVYRGSIGRSTGLHNITDRIRYTCFAKG